MTDDKEAFLDRWSRRKLEQAEEKPAAAPVAKEAENEPPVVLPPVESLTPESDFIPFMNAKVDGDTRRAALKKLFADAHFNVPDPFEAYSEDWTVGEPIPMEMLKTLNHAKKLLFDEPEKKAQAATAAAATEETAQAETPPAGESSNAQSKDPVGKQDA
jgi:hypothetical protein